MKTKTIRFVVSLKGDGGIKYVEAQERKWWGWKYITYKMSTMGGICVISYTDKTKEALLEQLLEKHYKNCKKHIQFIEYPSITIY